MTALVWGYLLLAAQLAGNHQAGSQCACNDGAEEYSDDVTCAGVREFRRRRFSRRSYRKANRLSTNRAANWRSAVRSRKLCGCRNGRTIYGKGVVFADWARAGGICRRAVTPVDYHVGQGSVGVGAAGIKACNGNGAGVAGDGQRKGVTAVGVA
jgi:hypothetical protein